MFGGVIGWEGSQEGEGEKALGLAHLKLTFLRQGGESLPLGDLEGKRKQRASVNKEKRLAPASHSTSAEISSTSSILTRWAV